jgi:hypothetical protein
MDKRVKALVIERTLVESDILATEWMLTKIDKDKPVISLAWDYLDLLDMVKVKVVNEYNKALGEL